MVRLEGHGWPWPGAGRPDHDAACPGWPALSWPARRPAVEPAAFSAW